MEGSLAVVRSAPELEEIVGRDAKLEKLAGGFAFTEGPIWVRDGYLLFSDIPHNVIRKWTPGGEVTVFRNHSGYVDDAPAGTFWGSNGLTLDHQGRLTACEHGNRRVTRLEPDGTVTVLADRFEGKRLNSPNDVVYKSDGTMYFSDPPYGLGGQDADPQKELKFNGFYRIYNGELQLLTSELTRPNGMAFSPDEKVLYVSNSDEKKAIWLRYDVKPDGTIENGEVIYEVTEQSAAGVPDGLKIDVKGNIYCAGPTGIWIFSPSGKCLGTIQTPEPPSNCHWGDEAATTLYITAVSGLYRIKLNIPGIRP